jgi:hypothetical protein
MGLEITLIVKNTPAWVVPHVTPKESFHNPNIKVLLHLPSREKYEFDLKCF